MTTRPRRHRSAMASACVAATVVALCGCGSTRAPTPAPPTASVTASGVTVTATLRPPREDRRDLEVTFTPQPGFHIYSVDLPAGESTVWASRPASESGATSPPTARPRPGVRPGSCG